MKRNDCLGFALPTILIASLIMLTVLAVTMVSISSTLAGVKNQNYNQMAQNASDAGIEYAKSCLRESDGVVTWSDNNPLTPSTDCSGNTVNNLACTSASTDGACFLSIQDNLKTTFSVGAPTTVSPGKSANLHSKGILYITKTSDNSVWAEHDVMTTQKANSSSGILTDGLVMNLDANKTSSYLAGGTAWSDLSGYDNNCTLVNGSIYDYTNNIGSVNFDGANDYAACNTSSSLNSANITYSMWVYVRDLTSRTEYTLIGKEAQYKMALYQGGYVRVLVSTDGVNWALVQNSTAPAITINKWWNIVMAVNSNGTTSAYVNGSLIGSWSVSAISTFNTNPTYIGDYYGDGQAAGTAPFLNGKIGQVAVYKKALSASDIMQNFDALRGYYGL